MRRQTDSGKRIVFFEPDLTETTTIARVEEAIAGGFDPIVFGFRRGRYNRQYAAPWSEIELGRTEDARYWRRVKSLCCAIPAVVRHRQKLRPAAIFLARNLDQLLLALLARFVFNRRAVLVYEVVDIQPAFTRPGFQGALIRFVERCCLRKIGLLIVSSPAFFHNYFAKVQSYRGEWLLLENKLRQSPEAASALQRRVEPPRAPRAGNHWVIGYFGLIRGQATIELMVKIARALPDTVEFVFRGVLTTVDHAWFHRVVAEVANIRYGGEYTNPGDLPALYGGVDLAWALDLEDTACNSRWLLPCRFYEAGFFAVPCLAVRDFEVGRLIDCLGVGWSFAPPLEQSLIEFFRSLTPALYEEKRRRLAACPTNAFVSGDADPILCQTLERLTCPPPPGGGHITFGKSAGAADGVSTETLEV